MGCCAMPQPPFLDHGTSTASGASRVAPTFPQCPCCTCDCHQLPVPSCPTFVAHVSGSRQSDGVHPQKSSSLFSNAPLKILATRKCLFLMGHKFLFNSAHVFPCAAGRLFLRSSTGPGHVKGPQWTAVRTQSRDQVAAFFARRPHLL